MGIRATNIASLIRQAPWLVLQPIDGQMLPVTTFLRIAGVTDVERVVRAYPKVLCTSIRGDLAPRVSEKGQKSFIAFRARNIKRKKNKRDTTDTKIAFSFRFVSSRCFFFLWYLAFLPAGWVKCRDRQGKGAGSLFRAMRTQRPVLWIPHKILVTRVHDALPLLHGFQVRFLWSDVGVSEEDLPKVLQTFPLLFALPLSRMQDVMAFLTEDLAINKKDTAKIIRYRGGGYVSGWFIDGSNRAVRSRVGSGLFFRAFLLYGGGPTNVPDHRRSTALNWLIYFRRLR